MLPFEEAFQDMSLLATIVFVSSLLAFSVYYVWRTRACGVMTTDVWFVLYFILVQNFLFLPVSYSKLNAVLLGDVYYDYVTGLDFVVKLSILGLMFFVIGAVVGWKSSRRLPGFELLRRSVERFWLTPSGLWLGVAILGLLIAVLLVNGVGFGQARLLVMEQPSLQPINNLLNSAAQLFVLIGLFSLLRSRRGGSVVLFTLILVASFYGGTRSASVWPVMLAGVVSMHLYRVRRYLPMLGALTLLVVVSVAYSRYRNGEAAEELSVADFFQELLFGGHLTEQRDFGWVLSAWDGTLLYGKSVLSGLMGFIPSFVSDFRQEWSWGKFTARAVGLDPTTFSGFRLPLIGEPYFNFSWPGVCIVSFAFGYVVFNLSHLVERAARLMARDPRRRVEAISLAATVAIYLNLFQLSLVSVTIFVVYVHILILVLGHLWSRRRRRRRVASGSAPSLREPLLE